VQVDLETPLSRVRAATSELGVSGFSALLAKAPPAGEELKCTLKVPGGQALETTATVADVKPQPGSVRVSFAFGRLPDGARTTIELLVVDTALSQLAA
jgi:hypothetical protein